MKAVKLQVQGQILAANGRFALLLQQPNPDSKTKSSIYLRFAFVTQGIEEHIFPAFLLDDWGSEIKSLALYDWVDQFAPQFPRAELFGFDQSGQETQLFLRELEQYSQWPCYAYPAADTAVHQGHRIEAILLPDAAAIKPVKIKRPGWVERPLRRAQTQWWQVPTTIQSIAQILT
jgi:hypothetical protein